MQYFIGDKVLIYEIEREILEVDENNNILVEIEITNNQGIKIPWKQWYHLED
jgi:hypothetical protein